MPGAIGSLRVMHTWSRENTPRTNWRLGPGTQGQRQSTAARNRHVLCLRHGSRRSTENARLLGVCESLEGRIENVDVVNKYFHGATQGDEMHS